MEVKPYMGKVFFYLFGSLDQFSNWDVAVKDFFVFLVVGIICHLYYQHLFLIISN